MPFFGVPDYESQLAEFPATGIDGVFVPAHFEALTALLSHPSFAGNVADRVIGGVLTFSPDLSVHTDLADRLEGVVYAEPGHDPNPIGEVFQRYESSFDTSFPDLAGSADFNPIMGFYNPMEAVLRALEAVDGDLANGQERFREALAALEFEAPNGVVRLDENRQAIGQVFLSRLGVVQEGEDAGQLFPETFRRINGVEQNYNGYFTSDSPEPSQTEPACVAGDPPPWATPSS